MNDLRPGVICHKQLRLQSNDSAQRLWQYMFVVRLRVLRSRARLQHLHYVSNGDTAVPQQAFSRRLHTHISICTVGCCYNAVQYDIIPHTPLRRLPENMDQSLIHNTPH